MKRFIIDFLLILMLVMIGSSMSFSSIDEKIDKYEESLSNRPIYQNTSNKATLVIKKGGEMIEDVVGIGVEVIFSIFKAIIE